MKDDSHHVIFMQKAIREAELAYQAGEFPVGCVIADGKDVIASGSRTTSRGITANEIDHAEILALRNLYEKWPGIGPDISKDELCLYSTLEPCLMCFGAILISGIRHIVYAFEDVMGGGTSCGLQTLTPLYRDIELIVTPHVCRLESAALMRAFFSSPDNSYLKDTLFSEYAIGLKC